MQYKHSKKQLLWIANASMSLHRAYLRGESSTGMGSAKFSLLLYLVESLAIPASTRKVSALSGVSLASTASTLKILFEESLMTKAGKYYELSY